MVMRGTTLAVVVMVIVVATPASLLLSACQAAASSTAESAQESDLAPNLGITYMPVVRRVSAYYDLGVDSGVLVTDVIANSAADRAGVKVGDVILSFNGTRLEGCTPLLGMMWACRAGTKIVMEVWRSKSTMTVELVHAENMMGRRR